MGFMHLRLDLKQRRDEIREECLGISWAKACEHDKIEVKYMEEESLTLPRAKATQLWGRSTEAGLYNGIEYFEFYLSKCEFFSHRHFVQDIGIIQETACNMF